MDSIGGLEASRPPKASSPMPSHPMPSEPCKKVHRTSQLNFCDAIPNPLPPPPLSPLSLKAVVIIRWLPVIAFMKKI